MTFNEEPAKELTKSFEKQERTQMIMEVGRMVLYPAIALVLIAMFWKSFKKTPSESLSGRAGPTEAAEEDEDSAGSFGRGRRGGAPQVVTVEVLNQLIKENPDNMMQAVRSWMTKGKPKNN